MTEFINPTEFIALGDRGTGSMVVNFLSVSMLSQRGCFEGQSWNAPWVIEQTWTKTYGVGSIPINTIFSGMNIHLPAILMFTRGTRFWHTAIWYQHIIHAIGRKQTGVRRVRLQKQHWRIESITMVITMVIIITTAIIFANAAVYAKPQKPWGRRRPLARWAPCTQQLGMTA